MKNVFFEKMARGYRTTAMVLLNTLALFIVLNLCIGVYFAAKDNLSRETNPVLKSYGSSHVESLYPGMSRDEVKRLLDESWSRPCVYEPFTQFRERARSGTYVNVDENGFRRMKDQGVWPPDKEKSFVVFVFGGSTTFGYGLPDNDTIPAHLQELLSQYAPGSNVRVYNFGRGFYYSTQERILFEKLLTYGFVPDAAVFIDGMNESYGASDEPEYTGVFREVMDGGIGGSIRLILKGLPMQRLASSIRNKLALRADKVKGGMYYNGEPMSGADEELVRRVIGRYTANRKAIRQTAASRGVKALFVWQPVPTYKYDLKYHPLWNESYKDPFLKSGYAEMAKSLQAGTPEDDLLWCADMQEDMKEPLYIDKLHYSSKMSKKVAQYIADYMVAKKMTGR